MVKSLKAYLIGFFIIFSTLSSVFAQESKKLAVLVGTDWYRDMAAHNDLEAAHKALRERGFSSEEIISLEGNLNRSMLVSFLTQIRQRTLGWENGTVFLYYSGHGSYRRISETEVEPGLHLNRNLSEAEQTMSWREVFETLKFPPQVKLLVLPDN